MKSRHLVFAASLFMLPLASQQSLADALLPGIQVDLSALSTVAALQLRGYALLVD